MSNRNVIVAAIKAAISAIEEKTGEHLSNYMLERGSMLNHKVWDRIRTGCPDRMTHSNIMRAAQELGIDVKVKIPNGKQLVKQVLCGEGAALSIDDSERLPKAKKYKSSDKDESGYPKAWGLKKRASSGRP